MMGDYPSTDFAITEAENLRRGVHVPTGIIVEAERVPDPVAVPPEFRIEAEVTTASYHPDEVAQAALRHLRVWLLRQYGIGGRMRQKSRM